MSKTREESLFSCFFLGQKQERRSHSMEEKKMLDIIMMTLLFIFPFLMFGLTEWSTTIVVQGSEDQ
jgi:hypothetical protein